MMKIMQMETCFRNSCVRNFFYCEQTEHVAYISHLHGTVNELHHVGLGSRTYAGYQKFGVGGKWHVSVCIVIEV